MPARDPEAVAEEGLYGLCGVLLSGAELTPLT